MSEMPKPLPEAVRTVFLEKLRRTGHVANSAAAAGMSRTTAYRWKDEDEEFSGLWDEAYQGALDDLEAECRRRALEGTLKPVFYQGAEVGHVREYSNDLAMFLLKGRRREVFGDKTDITSGGQPIKALIGVDVERI